MGKRYKKGNHGKKRKKPNKKYIQREQQLTKDIRSFKEYLFIYEVNDRDNYIEADRLRRKIKHNIRVQGRQVSSKSRQRRFIYYQQMNNFKGLYVTWKKLSLPTFLKVRYHIADHLIPGLCWFYIAIKTGVNYSYNIF